MSRIDLQKPALLAATALTVVSLILVPSWDHPFADVCHIAGILGALTTAAMWVTRAVGPKAVLTERMIAALFLAGMPAVYIVAWLQGGGGNNQWLWVELAGLPLYGGCAILGFTRSPWFIVGGIAAHGVAWDAWHYFSNTPYLPRWYAVACLIIDLGLAAYLACRVPVR